MKIVVVVNQKGGVGKTTTAANLSSAITILGHRVSAVDLDPQGHLTAYLGFAGQNDTGAGDIIMKGTDADQYLLKSPTGLQLLPSGRLLKVLENDKSGAFMTANVFAACLKDLFSDQEYVFIDCPPASGAILDYALAAVDHVLVPVAADYLALRGLSDLVITLRNFSRNRNDSIPQNIAVTRFHGKRRLCHEVRDKLVEYFPQQVLATPVRETAALAESPGFGRTVFDYKKTDHGATDYMNLAKDFIYERYM